MGRKLIKFIRNIFFSIFSKLIPELKLLRNSNIHWPYLASSSSGSKIDKWVNLMEPYKIYSSEIGQGTYLASNSVVSITRIGKYCSIGPNFLCGWGIHPTNGISTSPMFYSTLRQNGTTLSQTNKIEERKKITIGNDVFIGANVTVLDGVTIGDGAVIGAGAVVSKDIPPYAIAVGCPITIIRHRLPQEQVDKLLKIQWWNFENDQLQDVEKFFFDIESFIRKYEVAAENK